jgi:hypothetical protein
MAIEVFPTAQDIGGSGTGRTATEENMVQTLDRFSTPSTILSGMVPSIGTGLAVDVTAGRALVDGYLVRFTATEAVTVTASLTDYYLWLKLTGAGDDPPAVSATAWVEVATLAAQANAVLVGKFTTDGSAVTAIEDDERREGAGYTVGTYTGDGVDAGQDIDIGATPSFVQVNKVTTSPYTRMRISNIWPGNAVLTGYTTDAESIEIIKDGFKVKGDGENDNNRLAGGDYTYIAWF